MANFDGRSAPLFGEADRLRRAGQPLAALPLYLEAATLADGEHAAHQHLGALLADLGRPAAAEAALRRALALDPGDAPTRHGLAVTLMAQGRFRDAFPFYAVREEMPGARTIRPADFPFPRWSGEPLAGRRLTVFPEQGAGDQMMYARFVPELIRRHVAVTLLVLPALGRLMIDSFGSETAVVASGAVELPDPDYWISSSDLAAACGATYADLPRPPYLRATLPVPDLPAGFRTGLVTAGNPRFRHDARRSLPPDMGEALAGALPGAITPLAPELTGARDYAETAAIIAALDLVVTVDTSVAHLAGAMDKPVFLLLPAYGADWRWHVEAERTPWYPGMRLFRATLNGGWQPAVDAAAAAAHAMAGT